MSGTPEQIGPYRVDRELGRGGMGVVFLGHDTRLDRKVAIKALPEHLAQEPERLARFEREARTLASLNHPNVAGIHGVEEHDGHRYLVLEYVQGETLAERLDRGALPVDEALEIAIQIAAGVEAAHEAGVIHRDLKPGNVIVTPDGKAKVLDFGLAKAGEVHSGSSIDQTHTPTMTTPASPHTPTVPGAILGTAPYMSPEQARGRAVDKRTDIWSFGVLLYECLTGASPFIGETATDSIGAILHKDVDLDRLPPGTPLIVAHILRRCLERDRANRLRDIGDARIELERARTDEPIGAPAPVRRGVPWWIAGAAAIALAAAAAAVAWVVGGADTRATDTAPIRLEISFDEPVDRSGTAQRMLALSPDGRTIAYQAGAGGATHLYRRDLSRFDYERIPGTLGARTPFFSPDGARLAFFAQGMIRWVSLSGGLPLSVCPSPGLHYGGAWLQDGRLLFATNVYKYPHIVEASGGEVQELTIESFDAEPGAWRWPHALPDGEHVLMTYYGTLDGIPGPHVVVISIITGEGRWLVRGSDAQFIEPGYIIFDQGGEALAAPFDLDRLEVIGPARRLGIEPVEGDNFGARNLAVAHSGALVYKPMRASESLMLAWVSRDGAIQVIEQQPVVQATPRLSPDGREVLFWTWSDASRSDTVASNSAEAADRGVWVLDLATGRRRRLVSSDQTITYTTWSLDATHVISLQFESDGFSMTSVMADGSGRSEVISRSDFARLITSQAPDGSGALMYEVNPATNRDIWWWRGPDEDAVPLLNSPANERAGMVSPNSRWFAYVSDQSGRDEIYVTSYPDAEGRWLVSNGGGTEPLWSPDGTELFYRHEDQMMRVAVETEGVFRAAPPEELFRGSFVADPFGNANYDIDTDGSRFLMLVGTESERNQLRVVLGLQAELERLFSDR